MRVNIKEKRNTEACSTAKGMKAVFFINFFVGVFFFTFVSGAAARSGGVGGGGGGAGVGVGARGVACAGPGDGVCGLCTVRLL